jgi:hypothetical protein
VLSASFLFFRIETNAFVFLYIFQKPKCKKLKKVAFFLFAVSIIFQGFAQEVPTGLKTKNGYFKKFSSIKFTLIQRDSTGPLKGPKAKNQFPWEQKSTSGESLVVTKGNDSKKGLKSKNANPWDPQLPKTNSKASYEEPKSMKPRKRWFH